MTFIFQRWPIKLIVPMSIRNTLDSIIPFPEPKPSFVALLLLIGLWPGGILMAWKIGSRSLLDPLGASRHRTGKLFIQASVSEIIVHFFPLFDFTIRIRIYHSLQVFCSMSSFMLGYHVHEKAILTAIIPMTLLAPYSRRAARLYIRMCTFGLFGILPLLFRPEELLLKVFLFIAWMCGAICTLNNNSEEDDEGIHPRFLEDDTNQHGGSSLVAGQEDREISRSFLTYVDQISFAILGTVLLFMEVIHPIAFMPSGRMEFLPLMATSVTCASGLAWCWLESFRRVKR